jgi:hypothetical protein
MNLRKDAVKLIKKSRRHLFEQEKERRRAELMKSRPKKLVQRTLHSQIQEMNERIDVETATVYSENVEDPAKRRFPKKKKANNGV